MKNKLSVEDFKRTKNLFDSFNIIINDFEKEYLNYDYKKYTKKEDLRIIKEYRFNSLVLIKKIEDFFNSQDDADNKILFTSKDHSLIYKALFAVNNYLSNKVGLIILHNDDFANNIIKEIEKNNTAVFNLTEIIQ